MQVPCPMLWSVPVCMSVLIQRSVLKRLQVPVAQKAAEAEINVRINPARLPAATVPARLPPLAPTV